MAAKAGQALQVELLVTYGADPAGLDVNKLTPENLARTEGHIDLADRLIELQYELSDRMSNFVWGSKPGMETMQRVTSFKFSSALTYCNNYWVFVPLICFVFV